MKFNEDILSNYSCVILTSREQMEDLLGFYQKNNISTSLVLASDFGKKKGSLGIRDCLFVRNKQLQLVNYKKTKSFWGDSLVVFNYKDVLIYDKKLGLFGKFFRG